MRPEMLDPKIVRFLILSDGRSGTMMLTDALDSLPQTHFFNLFAVNIERPERFWSNWESFQQQRVKDITHLGTTMHRVGEEWLQRFPSSVATRFWQSLQDRHEKVICLRRRNKLKQLLSRKVGAVLKTYHVSKPRGHQPPPIEISVEELRRFTLDLERLREEIDHHFPDRLELTFEELANSWGSTIELVGRYIELDTKGLKTVTHRQETRELSEAIANYGEVATYLRETNREEWLD